MDDLLLLGIEIPVDGTAMPSTVAGIGAVPAPNAFGNPHYVQAATTYDTNGGNKSASLTPAVGSLLIVVCGTTANATDPTVTDDQGGTYTKLGKAVRGSSGTGLWIFARTALVSSAVSHTVTMTEGTNNGGGLSVQEWYGFHRVGATALVQAANQDNVGNAGGSTPAPTFGASVSARNAVVAALSTSANPAAASPPSGFTERLDTGYASPNAGLEIATIDLGQTGTSLSWGASITAGVAYCDLAVELDTRGAEPVTVAGVGAVPAPNAFADGGATALPAAVAGVGAVPAATASGEGTTTPTAVAGVGSVPSATAVGPATATPSVTVGIGAVPPPAASGNAGDAFALPSVVGGIGAVPAPTATGGTGATATPSAVAGVGAVPAPTAMGEQNGLANPASVDGLARISQPRFPSTVAPGGGSGGSGGGGTSEIQTRWTIDLHSDPVLDVPFRKMRLVWTLEGPGSCEIDLRDDQMSTDWTPGLHSIHVHGEQDWSGKLTHLARTGSPDGEWKVGWKASGLGLQHLLDYRIVRHQYVIHDHASLIVESLLNEAQGQFNGDMGMSMGDVTGTTPIRLASYCFGVNIAEAIRDLASMGDNGFDWEIDADGRLNIWQGTRGVDTGRTLAETQTTDWEIELDTSELLTTVSALAEPSDPFGPRHKMSRTMKADDYGRSEIAIDTDILADPDKNPDWQQDLQDAARAVLREQGGGYLTLEATWPSHKAPWSMADVWLGDSVTVSLPDVFGGDIDMRVTDVTVTLEPMPPRDGGALPPVYWITYGFDALVRDLEMTDGDPDGEDN